LTTRVSPSHNRGSVTPTASITTFKGRRVLRRESRETCVEDICHLPVYRNILSHQLNKSRRGTGFYDSIYRRDFANGLATDAGCLLAVSLMVVAAQNAQSGSPCAAGL
jgi:hypothetical protein